MTNQAALLFVLGALAGCAVYDAPPEATIEGLQEGFLPDPQAPLVLSFSKPPVASTLKLEVARYVVDADGLLGDEPGNTLGMPLDTLFAHDPVSGDTGGTAELSADGSTLTIIPSVVFPVGASLVVLVEPGLSDAAGTVTRVRRRLVFAYAEPLDCNAPAHVFRTGTYFFLAAVDKPVGVQVVLYGVVDLDTTTGKIKGQFTRAKRNPDVTRCTPPCAATEVCRTVGAPMQCVAPGTYAGSVDEFTDYVPNPDPPNGFSFATTGCAPDQLMMTAGFATTPVDVSVQTPMVTLRNASLSASFAPDASGTLRGMGGIAADALLLGTNDVGMAQGTLTARSLADTDVPAGLPQPQP
jgi:hypothetical protein